MLDDLARRSLIAHYGNDIGKEWLHVVGGYCIIALIVKIFFDGISNSGVLIIAGFILFAALIKSLPRIVCLFRSFGISAYPRGVEISGIGFFPWSSIDVYALSDKLILTVSNPAPSIRPRNIFDGGIVCEVLEKGLIITISIPLGTRKGSATKFCQLTRPYWHENGRRVIDHEKADIENDIKAFSALKHLRESMGEKPPRKTTKAEILITSIMIIAFCYLIFVPNIFLIGDKGFKILMTVTIVLTLPSWLYLCINAHRKKLNPHSIWLRFPGYILCAPLVALFVFITLLAPAIMYTNLAGTPFIAPAYYENKKSFETSSKRCGRDKVFKSPAIKTFSFSPVCIKRELYNMIPQEGIFVLSGHDSVFGRDIDAYLFPAYPSYHERMLNQKAEIDKLWEKF